MQLSKMDFLQVSFKKRMRPFTNAIETGYISVFKGIKNLTDLKVCTLDS